MIYHEMFGQHLRLGNFLFKYAWSIMQDRKYGRMTCYPDNYYLWKYLQHPPKQSNSTEYWKDEMLRPRCWEWSLEEENYVNNFLNQHPNVDVALNFFFQSEQWFRDYKDEVRKALRFTDKAESDVIYKYGYLFNRKGYSPSIGIGVRLGDFVNHGDFYQIPIQWYLDALENNFPYWGERPVVIFSDDIILARKLFEEKGYSNFYYAEPNGTQTHADNFKHYHGDASEHLILGSLMDDFIIGNSTFSWWQAWLATYNKPGSRVIHSGKVFSETGNMKHVDTSLYYPKNWIKYEN